MQYWIFLGTNREDYSGPTGCSWGQIERTAQDDWIFLGTNRGDCSGRTGCSWGQIEKTAQDVLDVLGDK